MLGVQTLGPIVPRQVAEGATSNGAPSATNSAVTESCAGIGSGRVTDTISCQQDLRTRDRDGRAERDAWVILLTVPGLGPVTFASLLEAFRSATEVLEIASQPDGAMRLREGVADRSVGESAAVRSGPQLGEDLARRIRDHVAEGATILDLVRSLGLTVVTVDDSAYPERLRRVDMPPPLLFVKGSTEALTCTHAVAVVGTRWPTDKGRLIAGWIGSSLARAGAVVVSGLAVGIDGAAHASVGAAGMPPIAVLGGGH